MRYEDGMKVRIHKEYCDFKDDGITRESDLRYVVMEMPGGGHYLLAKTKKQAENGEGWIYDEHSIREQCGWWG